MGIFDKFFPQRMKEKQAIANIIDASINKRLISQINQYAPLIQLQDERQLIEVLIQNETDSFQTMIIGVDLYQQQLSIDELSPKLFNPESLIGKTITIRHQSKQKMLTLTSKVIDWDDLSLSFLLNLPSNVAYKARRSEPRVPISNQAFKAVIDPIYGAPWYAGIVNISQGGMRIVVTGDIRSNLHKNKPLRDCELEVDNHVIHSPGLVKSFSYFGRPYRRTEVSIAFENMGEEEHILLSNLISQLCIPA